MLLRALRNLKLLLLLLLLFYTSRDLALIPFLDTLGVDLQNLYLFHHCSGANNPYLLTGAQCGDPFGRDMFYPPLMYFAFAWTRLVGFPFATGIWAAFLGASSLICLWAWLPSRVWRTLGGMRPWLLLLALLAQYPMAFAIERGNCDILPLIGWTLAFRLWLAERPAWSGFAAGAAVALKLYPAFACAIVAVGVLGVAIRERKGWRTLAWFGLGGVAAPALALLAFLEQSKDYLRDELPRFAAQETGLTIFLHTLRALQPERSWVFPVTSACLFGCWAYASFRHLRRDPALVFAGALAMTTYFARTSYDYNLITAYPVLALLALRALEGDGRVALKNLLLSGLGILVFFGGRRLCLVHHWAEQRIAAQLVWLCVAALLARRSSDVFGEWRSRESLPAS